ncbi:hypothetical protein H5410_014704 [Solanum commersonii]|uniref:Uncharacterized protein n=1 Tax=Solanum commersonii TaxID=4109 RepID=A0A9J5ZRS2_SOLCO|nr:hypothetical protein H5410_014704 [Solanum commersonii]
MIGSENWARESGPNPSVVGGVLELLLRREWVATIHQVLDCSPTNRERQLGLDCHETGKDASLSRPRAGVPKACDRKSGVANGGGQYRSKACMHRM